MAGLKSASPLPTARAGLEPLHEQMVAFLGTLCEQHDQLDEWGCGIWAKNQTSGIMLIATCVSKPVCLTEAHPLSEHHPW